MAMLGHQIVAQPMQDVVDEEKARIEALQKDLDIEDFLSTETPVPRRQELLAKIRERYDTLAQSQLTALFLRAVHPAICASLTTIDPNYQSAEGTAAPANVFRAQIVDFLGHVPVADLPRPCINDLLNTCHAILSNDHEDNGMVAQRLLFDAHKQYKQALEDQSAPFFEWLKQLYDAFPTSFKLQIESKLEQNGNYNVAMDDDGNNNNKEEGGKELRAPATAATTTAAAKGHPLIPAKGSFKLAAEVALMIVFLVQCYPAKMMTKLPEHLLPKMVTVINIAGPKLSQVPASLSAVYAEFRMAQIKTLSFLAIMARSRDKEGKKAMEPFKEPVCSALIHLMQHIPLTTSARKELLIVFKNIVFTDFRSGLMPSLDMLLDENVLLGGNASCRESLRHLAMNTLAEYIMQGKQELSLEHIQKAAAVFAAAAQDTTVSPSLQSTSLRLLYNLVDPVYHRRGESEATAQSCRALLSLILDTFVSKLGQLGKQAAQVIGDVKYLDQQRKDRKAKEAATLLAEEAVYKKGIKKRREQLDKKAEQYLAASAAAAAGVKQEGEGGANAADGAEPMQVEVEVKEEEPATTAAATAADEESSPQPPSFVPEATEEAAPEEGEEDKEDKVTPNEPFKTVLASLLATPPKERELSEFRHLLWTVFSSLKTVMYTVVSFHTNKALAAALSFRVDHWSTRPDDVTVMSHILPYAIPAILFYDVLPISSSQDMRDYLIGIFSVFSDHRDYADIIAPKIGFLYNTVLENRWYMRVLRQMVEGESAQKNFVNRHAISCILQYLTSEKIDTLEDMESEQGKLTAELLEMCFEKLPLIQQTVDNQKAAELASLEIPTIEKLAAPHIIKLVSAAYPRLAAGGSKGKGFTRVLRELFYRLAQGKFLEIQLAIGTIGMHTKIVDLMLSMLSGPALQSKEEQETAAELCLLVPARLEQLIQLIPRMMHAIVRALRGSDRAVSVALKVLDVWVDSFNPEFIEKSMASVVKDLMQGLWFHLQPHPHPFGTKVAEMLGKMGGRSRRWLADATSIDYKPIPEYGLRVILAFPPSTSFLVPLDRCIQFAQEALDNSASGSDSSSSSSSTDGHKRKVSLKLLQICIATLMKLQLPKDMMPPCSTSTTTANNGGEKKDKENEASPIIEEEVIVPGSLDYAACRIQGLLFGEIDPPSVPIDAHWPHELGLKTRKQLSAEKSMLESLITAILASGRKGDVDLESMDAAVFAESISRHFAMLFAAGWATYMPPPVPPSTRCTRYTAPGGGNSNANTANTGTANTGTSNNASYPAAVATLKHIQPHIVLDALQSGFGRKDPTEQTAVIECMCVFVDTLLELGAAQDAQEETKKKQEKATAHTTEDEPAAAAEEEEDDNEDDDDDEKKKKKPSSSSKRGGSKKKDEEDTKDAESKEPSSKDQQQQQQRKRPKGLRYVQVLYDLLQRAMHCCYGDTWQVRLGGMRAMKELLKRLPHEWLVAPAQAVIRAVCAVARSLPDHAVALREEIDETLIEALKLCLESSPSSHMKKGDGGKGETSPGGTGTGTRKRRRSSTKEEEQGEDMDVDEEQAAAVTTTGKKGGKRGGKKQSAQHPRKKLAKGRSGSHSAAPEDEDDEDDNHEEEEDLAMTEADGDGEGEGGDNEEEKKKQEKSKEGGGGRSPALSVSRILADALVRELFSSKSTDPVRTASLKALQFVADSSGTTITALLQLQQDRLRPVLVRRLLPLKAALSVHAAYAHSMALLMKYLKDTMPLNGDTLTFISEACYLAEEDDNALALSVTQRGGPPKAESLAKLKRASLEVLVAAVNWSSFRDLSQEQQRDLTVKYRDEMRRRSQGGSGGTGSTAPAPSVGDASQQQKGDGDKSTKVKKEEANGEEAEKQTTSTDTPATTTTTAAAAAVAPPPKEEEAARMPRDIRSRVVAAFITQLGSSDKIIVSLASQGLSICQHHPHMLSKPWLQDALRPILTDFAHYQKITLPLLKHLHRLLNFLSSQFNVTLGEKLTEHLKHWMKPDLLTHPPQDKPNAWEAGTEWEVAAAMLDIFHKLPEPAGAMFLETQKDRPGIVVLTIGLEESLRKVQMATGPSRLWSPLRAPLAKFLCKYKEESISYFLDAHGRLAKSEYMTILLDIIRNPVEGKPLLDALAAASDKIARIFTEEPRPTEQDPEGSADAKILGESQTQVVHLVRAMVRLLPDWLPTELYETMLVRWRERVGTTTTSTAGDGDGGSEKLKKKKGSTTNDADNDASSPPSSNAPTVEVKGKGYLPREKGGPRNHALEGKRLGKILVNYISRNHNETEAVFDLLNAFNSDFDPGVDFSFIKNFFAKTVAEEFNIEAKRSLLVKWIDMYTSNQLSQEKTVYSLRLLINPMLTFAMKDGQQSLLTPPIIASLVQDVFKNPTEDSSGSATNNNILATATDTNTHNTSPSELVQAELVQLCSILIQHAHPLFQEYRKEIIQFGWWTLKCDNAAKPYGFLMLAHFFKVFISTPEKIMLQVYVALARTPQPESASREAARQAVDIIIPTLAELPAATGGGGSGLHGAGGSVISATGSEDATAGGGGGGASLGRSNSDGQQRGASTGLTSPGSVPAGGSGGTTGTTAVPSFARYLKKVLSEEGHTSVAQYHIFQMVARNRDYFYNSRALFIGPMLTALPKLGLPSASSLESRILSIDMASTMMYWDIKAAQEEEAAKGTTGTAGRTSMEVETTTTNNTSTKKDDDKSGSGDGEDKEEEEQGEEVDTKAGGSGSQQKQQQQQQTPGSAGTATGIGSGRDPARLTHSMDEMIINFLLRMVFVSCDNRDRDDNGWRRLHAHSLEVLKDSTRLKKFSRPLNFKLNYFEKFLSQNLIQYQQMVEQAQQQQRGMYLDPPTALVAGLRVAQILMETQPDAFVRCAGNQVADEKKYLPTPFISLLFEPTLHIRHRLPVDLLSASVKKLFAAFPCDLPAMGHTGQAARRIQTTLHEVLNKYISFMSTPDAQGQLPSIDNSMFIYVCAALAVIKAGIVDDTAAMKPLVGPLLKTMHRIAREHNQNPSLQLLSIRSHSPRMAPSENDYGAGPWFMYHALHIVVPSALTLSADHRKHFLSCLVMLITGQSVRASQTDPSILFTILDLMKEWLLNPQQAHLTQKELLVLLQRLAQLERLHAIPINLKPQWDEQFLNLLYTVITRPKDLQPGAAAAVAAAEAAIAQAAAQGQPAPQHHEIDFGNEVFLRVERTFCCGLQSNDPIVRSKFFKLYASRIPPDLYDRLRYVIAVQDWESLSHTFWLKHGVGLLFDILQKSDHITLAYNSAHVPPLFDYKKTWAFLTSAQLQQASQQRQTGVTTAAEDGGGGGVAAATNNTDGAGNAIKEGSGDTEQAKTKETQEQEGGGNAATTAAGGGEGQQEGGGAAPMETDQRTTGAAATPAPTAAAQPTTAEQQQKQPRNATPSATAILGILSEKEEAPKPLLNLPHLSDSLRSTLTDHASFLQDQQQASLRSASLVSCLIDLVQTDPKTAHHLWVLLFPIVWTSLAKEQQTGLAKPIIQLLSKEHHTRQNHLRPTCGQTLLEGISMSQPQPKIPAEMIKYMGKHFHAWHIAISMLESHVGLFPRDMRCFDAVCDLYSALGEADMAAGLWQRRAMTEETRLAMALFGHGYLPEAQNLFLELMSRGMSRETTENITKSEMVLWHNKYLECCQELNQWDVVFDYAKATDNGLLQVEASARLFEWNHLKVSVLPRLQAEESPELIMIRTQLALREGQIAELDKVCKQALALCVHRWWLMPESSPWSYAPVLHTFQRAVELGESWRIRLDFNHNGGPMGQYQELKDICDTWKLRVPNEWEPVKWWSDILTWRNQIYNLTIQQFATLQQMAPTLHQMGYRDKAWSVNKLGHVMRLHHLPDACVQAINNLYGFNAMEVQEAFVKVQEQGKAYLLQPHEYLHGLNLINSTNMDYFQPPHQAEMINLKAQFLHLLGDTEAAHQTFSQAVTLYSNIPDIWIAWGRFCDEMYTRTLAVGQQHAAHARTHAAAAHAAAAAAAQKVKEEEGVGKEEGYKEEEGDDASTKTPPEGGGPTFTPPPPILSTAAPPPPPHLPPAEWLEYAAMSYTQGIRMSASLPNSTMEARCIIPRLLQLLMLDVHGASIVGKVLVDMADLLPSWVWLPYLPQLLTSLQRPEMQAAKKLIITAATHHAQHVYWHLRPYTVHLKELTLASQQRMAAAAAAAAKVKEEEGLKKEEEDKDEEGEQGEQKKGEESSGKRRRTISGTTTTAPEDDAATTTTTAPTPAPAPAPQPQQQHNNSLEMYAFEAAKEIADVMRMKQPAQLSLQEALITELSNRFATKSDERLLSVIATLLQRCHRFGLPPRSAIPEQFRKELAGVCKACLSNSNAVAATDTGTGGDAGGNNANAGGSSSGGGGGYHASKYQALFAIDLDLNGSNPPTTLDELTEKLKGWRVLLETLIEEHYPTTLKTEIESPTLFDISFEELEMPLQSPWTPESSEAVYIERVGAGVEIVRRNYSSHRRIVMHGSDGKARYMLLTSQGAAPSEERVLAFLRNANATLLASHPESRRRGLSFVAPNSLTIYVGQNVRLMEEDRTAAPFLDAYETHCARYGRDPDLPITSFKALCATEEGLTRDVATRLSAYQQITTTQVNENIFSQYIYKTMVENTQMMWAYKKQFAASAAMSAVSCYLLLLQGRSPGKMLVSKSTGKIVQADLMTTFDVRFQLEGGSGGTNGESVPFRLTRNMQAFIGPHGFDGAFIASGTAAAQGLQSEKSPIGSMMALFLRDDVLASVCKRTGARNVAAIHSQLKPSQLEACVSLNVRSAQDRLANMGPKNSVNAQNVNPQAGFRRLAEQAILAENLCMMEPTWHPWL